jgi:hypothetical protein
LLDVGVAGSVFGVVISTLLLVLNAYTKNYDLGELAQKHRQAASDIWLVRESYLSLITDLVSGSAPLQVILKARDDLMSKLHGIYSGSPSTTLAAYRKAQAALQTQEDMTFSDAEIDAFLPSQLKWQ